MRSLILAALSALASSANAQAPSAALTCEEPELWLSEYALDEIPSAYCRACGDRCVDGTMRWGPLSGTSGLSCRELEYAAIAVGAVRGERVVDPDWRAYFEARPWYRPGRPRWTQAARESQAWLRTEASACRARHPEPPIEPHVRSQMARFYAAARRGRPILPSALYLGEERGTRTQLGALLRSVPAFTSRTSIRSATDPLSPIASSRTYEVDTRSISCVEVVDEMCDQSTHVELRFDREGRLTGVRVQLFG
jgi:hypothetical protein